MTHYRGVVIIQLQDDSGQAHEAVSQVELRLDAPINIALLEALSVAGSGARKQLLGIKAKASQKSLFKKLTNKPSERAS